MQGQPGPGPDCRPGRSARSPSRVVAADEPAELLGHGVNQLLLVSLVFTKLCKHVVLAARVLHPEQRRREREQVFEGTVVEGELARVGWYSDP